MDQNKMYENIANQILAFIQNHDNYLISAHIHADGDAYASMVAVHLLLTAMGKKTVMVLSDEQNDQRFDFLKDFNNFQNLPCLFVCYSFKYFNSFRRSVSLINTGVSSSNYNFYRLNYNLYRLNYNF